MKCALIVLVLTSVMVAAQDPSGPPSAQAPSSNPVSQAIPTDQANSRKARAFLDQAIQALGGDAYLKVRDLSTEGRGYSFHRGEPNSLGTLFCRFYKYHDKDRIELTKKRE